MRLLAEAPGSPKINREAAENFEAAHNALALPLVVFCRKTGFQLSDLCSERRDMRSKGIAFIACSSELAA